jgi:hypothetical protein
VIHDVISGFAIGTIVGIAVGEAARGRRSEGDLRRIRDGWALVGAALGLAWGISRELL